MTTGHPATSIGCAALRPKPFANQRQEALNRPVRRLNQTMIGRHRGVAHTGFCRSEHVLRRILRPMLAFVLDLRHASGHSSAVSSVKTQVEEWIQQAVSETLGSELSVDPMVRSAKDARFGDYQSNLAMPLAKALGRKPRDIAEQVAKALKTLIAAGMLDEVSIAGPGFINLKLSSKYVDDKLASALSDPRLGVPISRSPATVVVDYSSPNLAKEMHIGHLRSSIIGDAIARILMFHGDCVIRQNHLGDWGTQFGMLLEHLIDTGWDRRQDHNISDLNTLYQEAKKRFDAESDFANRSRQRVVSLQAGEERATSLWRHLIDESIRHMDVVYEKLGLLLESRDIKPESYYNPTLASVVTDLRGQGLLTESQGAQVVFPEGFRNKEGEPLPLIVQKKDGGFGYATTDLAAAKHRAQDLSATRIIYVVDSRQSDHFGQLFWTLRQAKWVGEAVKLDYVPFGTILGTDRRPFKTREGGTVRLVDVLDEAVARARAVIESKSADLEPAEKDAISRAVGVGAVKYADLSSERIKDYIFDYDRMLAMDGNTAPYLQNAYVRIRSIFRKGAIDPSALAPSCMQIRADEERALALLLLQFPSVIEGVVASLEPHRLCNYLYDLAASFHTFYEKCPVLKATSDAERDSRLVLSHLVASTLKRGLGLLGIDTVEQM